MKAHFVVPVWEERVAYCDDAIPEHDAVHASRLEV
jgi:hypothetical protein